MKDKAHPVATQWHYKIMLEYGYIAKTVEAHGFVRSYEYENASGHKMLLMTGSHSDYWIDMSTKKQGLWTELEKYLANLKGAQQ